MAERLDSTLRLTPTPEQEAAIQRMVSEPTRAVLQGSELGTGKSLMTAEVVKRLDLPVNLITAPLHTRDGWERAFNTQLDAEIRFVNRNTKAGKQAFADLEWGIPGNYFMGRELARLVDWSEIPLGFWAADESHSFSNNRSKGFKAHQKMRTDFKVLQSATFFGSSFEGAWAPARILWPELDGRGQVADISYYRWLAERCETEYDRFAPNHKRVIGEKEPGRFVSELPCYVSIKSDLPEIEPIPVYYDLSPKQQKLYRQMEEEGVAWLRNEGGLAADLPITQRIRLREITLAEVAMNADGEIFYPDDAHSSLLDVVREMLGDLIGEQVVMGTHSAKFARFAATKVPGAFAWTGDVKQDERDVQKERFISGNIDHIIATHAAAAEGLDGWQHASHVLFELSQSDSLIAGIQFRGRLNRSGQSKRVVSYQFRARGTIDDPQAETLLSRELAMRQSVR